MVPLDVFSLLAMRRVTGELRTSTGDAAMDKARRRVVNRDAEDMIDRCSNMRTIPDFVAHYMSYVMNREPNAAMPCCCIDVW